MATKKKRTKPVVKKRKKSTRKKKGKGFSLSSFAFSVRNLIVWLILILLAVFAVLYLNECSSFRPLAFPPENAGQEQSSGNSTTEQTEPVNEPQASSGNTTSLSINFPPETELPQLKAKRKGQVLSYEGYTVSYNVDYKLANWVAWELTAEEALSKKEERKNKFSPDPSLKGKTAMNEDYSKSGYDRGHLAPAGDMKWSMKSMQQSFYYSNIAPQYPKFNQGIWNNLENQCRQWAVAYDGVLIVTGPVLEEGLKRLGKNRVAIPKQFYKVICAISDNEYKGIAFLLDNKDYKKTSLKSLAVPIDRVEKATGIEFFPTLPEQASRKMKQEVDMACWFD